MNRMLLWLLSRRLLGRRANLTLVGLRVRGRRSGQLSTFPVEYAVDPFGLIVMPAHHESKTWWRNLMLKSPVEILWMGRWVGGQGSVLWAWDADYAAARAVYLARFPHVTPDFDQPFVRISFDD